MSLIDDLKSEAPRIEKEIEFRGHKVIIKTLLGMEASEYFKYITDNKLNTVADFNAATIAASIFTPEGERLPTDVIPAIRDNWTQKEVTRLMRYCDEVGNSLISDEQEKKE